MKITKRQLKRIIREEQLRPLKEGQAKEMEIQLIEDVVDMLLQRGAIRGGDNDYAEALEYIKWAIIPTLEDWSK